MTVPETPSTPTTLLDWLAGLRDVGELDPIIVAVRDGQVIASGFIHPRRWTEYASLLFYGFAADVIGFAMDVFGYDGDDPATATPAELHRAGHPDAFEALYLQWLPLTGPTRQLQRRHVETDHGLEWSETETLDDARGGSGYVDAEAVRRSLDLIVATQGPASALRPDLSRAEHDRATATYFGLELRT